MKRLLYCLVIFLCFSACSNLTVSGKYISDKSLSEIQFFSFHDGSYINPGSPQYNIAILNDILQKKLSDVLLRKNIQNVKANKGQMLVYYQLDIERKVDEGKLLEQLGGDPYKVSGASVKDSDALVPGLDAPRVNNYAYGDLLIRVFDMTGKELIWQGKAGLAIADIPEYSELQQQFHSVLYKMFRQFP